MSELRSVIDQMAAVSDNDLSTEELDADLSELGHAEQMIQVLRSRKVKSLTDRGGHHDLGYSSPSAYLTDRGRMTPWHARQVISRANAREKAPLAYRAWADGRLSTDQASHLFAAAENVPDAYPDSEETLVNIVERLDAADTRKAVEYWRQSVDGPGQVDPETQWARRGLNLSRSISGWRRVDGWLTDSTAEAFESSLDANMPPPREGDTRTPRQRRHDALDNLCRDWLDNGTNPTIGGEKPHIMVLGDIEALRGVAGGLHETINGDIVDVDTLRMLACDCSVTRIVFGPESEVLDVGRKTRVWTAAQRRAIIARDRHCQGPGCRAKPRHCDIHHTEHWADLGETSVDKGKLFCRPCHMQEHANDRYRRRRTRARTKG